MQVLSLKAVCKYFLEGCVQVLPFEALCRGSSPGGPKTGPLPDVKAITQGSRVPAQLQYTSEAATPLMRMSQAITQGSRVPAQAPYTPGGPKSPGGLTVRKRDKLLAHLEGCKGPLPGETASQR